MLSFARHPPAAPAPSPQLQIAVRGEGETLHLLIEGELDLTTSGQLASHLRALTEEGDVISLNLARVTFIDLSGLRVLLEAGDGARACGKRVSIAVPGSACERLLDITRTAHLLRADSTQLG